MRPLPHRRRRAKHPPKDTDTSLARLRRRCMVGVCLAAAAFIAAFITDIGRRSPGDDASVLGVEIAATGFGAVCAGSATLAKVIGHLGETSEASRADDLSWAYHLGTNVADSYRAPVVDITAPRGPKAR